MSSGQPKRRSEAKIRASIFAALGDETRLTIIGKLSSGAPLSISRLTVGSRMTRQAMTKHLRVLEEAGVVRGVRVGRESQFELRPDSFTDIQSYLRRVSEQWEDALARLKAFVET